MSKQRTISPPSPTPSRPVATAPAKSPDPIALHAPGAAYPDGYGTLAYEIRRALDTRGLLDDASATTLALGDPIRWPRERGRRVIGFALPESDELYPAVIAALHGPADLAAPSQWAAELVAAATLRSVRAVPLGVASQRFAYRRRERGEALRFLHIAPRTDDSRKGTDLVIAAFARAFPRRDDVSLMVRSALGATSPPRSDPRVTFAVGALQSDQLPELLYRYDALIAPSRAEAFGLLPLEAMACGLPAIFTGATGGLEYVDLGLPVSAREVRAPRPRLGNWVEPSLDDLVDRLREVDTEYDDVHERCAADARAIAERFTWSRTITTLLGG